VTLAWSAGNEWPAGSRPGLLAGLGLIGAGIGLSSAGLQTAAIEAVGPRESAWRPGLLDEPFWAALSGPACSGLLGPASDGVAGFGAVFLMAVAAHFCPYW